MKNNFITKIIGATLAFAMMIGGAVGINAAKEAKMVDAETSSVTFSDRYNANTTLDGTAIQIATGLTVTFNKASGSTAPQYYTTGTAVRWYSKNTMVLNSTAGNITSVTITFGGSDGSNSITAGAGTWVSPTWTGDAESVTLTVGGTSGNRRVAGLSVTYGESAQVQDAVSVALDKDNLNLDLYNDANTGSLTATATKTGNATLGLTAMSSDETVATVSTASPTSGTAFIVTGHSVGTATITVTSTWDDTKSDSCLVTVIDTTPRIIDLKKVDELEAGQQVLITSLSNNTYYYLPSTTNTNANTSAVQCAYNSETQRLESVNAAMMFTVSNEDDAWQFKNGDNNYLCITGTDAKNIRVTNGSHKSFTVEATSSAFYLKNNNYNKYLGKYVPGSDWRAYASRTENNFKDSNNEYSCDHITFWVEAKEIQTISGAVAAYTDETVTLTSNAANPTWSIVTGDTTAEGAQVTAAGVVSVSGAGTVKVKAAHADYEDAFHTITFSVRPSESYINVEQESVSGFTGLHETLEFDFGNIDNPATAINVVSSNTSIVTVNAPSIAATTGSVQINFVGAGTTTVKFNEGEEEKDSVTVTVTQSSVSITGMPATGSLFVGNTLNLGSQVTVTATGSCSNAVTWESDNENVATVTDAGVVTGVTQGTANITITSVSNDNVSATCAVTVSRALFTTADSFQNGKRYIIATSDNYYLPAATQLKNKNPAASQFASISELEKEDAWYASVDANNHIVFSNTVGNETFYLNATATAQGISFGSAANGYWTLTNTGYLTHSESSNRYLAAATSSNDFRHYTDLQQANASFATVFYEYIPTAKEEVEELKTSTSLSYTDYHAGENGTFNYDNLAIRFGGKITPTLWNKLDTESHIEGFGVLLAVGDLDGDSIETWYNAYKTESNTVQQAIDELETDGVVEEYYKTKQQKAHPTQVGDVYSWNLYEEIEDSTASILEERTAVAYIRIENDIVFLKQDTVSAKSLAFDLIDSGAYEDNAFGGSLHYMAYLNN